MSILFFTKLLFATVKTTSSFHSSSDYDENSRATWTENDFEFSDGNNLLLSFFSYYDLISFYRKEKYYFFIQNRNESISFFAGDFFVSHGCQTSIGSMDNSGNNVYNLNIESLKIIPDDTKSGKNFSGAGISLSLISKDNIILKNIFIYSCDEVYSNTDKNNHIASSLDEIIFNSDPSPDKSELFLSNCIFNNSEIILFNNFTISALWLNLCINQNNEKISWEKHAFSEQYEDEYNNLSILLKYQLDSFIAFYEISSSEINPDEINSENSIFCAGFKFSTNTAKSGILVKKRGLNYFSPFSREAGGSVDSEYLCLSNCFKIGSHFRLEADEEIEKKIYADYSFKYLTSNSCKLVFVSDSLELYAKSSQQKNSGSSYLTSNNLVSAKLHLSGKITFSAYAGNENFNNTVDFYETSFSFQNEKKFSLRTAFYEKKTDSQYYRSSNEISCKLTNNVQLNSSVSAYFKKSEIYKSALNFSIKTIF